MSSYTIQPSVGLFPNTNPAVTAGAVGGVGAGGVGVGATGGGSAGVYDIHYLSNYMRMMGIQPPTTQQQWAYLLASVSGPSGLVLPGGAASSKAHGMLSGPDLSHLFASKAPASTIPPSYHDPSALVTQKASLMSLLGGGGLGGLQQQQHPMLGVAGAEAVPTSFQGAGVSSSAVSVSVSASPHSQLSQSNNKSKSGKKKSVKVKEGGAPDRKNPMYCSSSDGDGENNDDDDDDDEDDDYDDEVGATGKSPPRRSKSKGQAHARPHSVALSAGITQHHSVYRDVTSRDEASVTRVQVPDYREVYDDRNNNSANNNTNNDNNGVSFPVANGSVPNSVSLSKTLSFNSATKSPTSSTTTRAHDSAVGHQNVRRVLSDPSNIGVNGDVDVNKGDNDNNNDDGGFRTVEFSSASPLKTSSSSSAINGKPLSPRVYGPIGYRPISFSPTNSPR
jgi:hypothetical protein